VTSPGVGAIAGDALGFSHAPSGNAGAGGAAGNGRCRIPDRDGELIAELLAEGGDPDADDVDFAEDAAVDDTLPDTPVNHDIDEEVFNDALVDPLRLSPWG
jgi:hypothetical protein